MLCTYQSITFRKMIMSNPTKILLYFCDCFAKHLGEEDKDSSSDHLIIDRKVLYSIFNTGSRRARTREHLDGWIEVCAADGVEKNAQFLRMSTVKQLLEFDPSLAIDFRENVYHQLNGENRLELVSEKQVSFCFRLSKETLKVPRHHISSLLQIIHHSCSFTRT